MTDKQRRIEEDSLGRIEVPADALWGAQTQRALQNFPISGIALPERFISALVLLKSCVATANGQLGELDQALADGIADAADQILAGQHRDQFGIDVFQTGSGTSSNMNANEVIACIASAALAQRVDPNDHVNRGQSSNDVFPASINLAAGIALKHELLPAMHLLIKSLTAREREFSKLVITGRTHLMDAMPVTMGQQISGWRSQIESSVRSMEFALHEISQLTIGGTAVGTGINAHPQMSGIVCELLSQRTGQHFRVAANHFEAQSSQDSAAMLSGHLKVLAVALMKICNDLRLMNSGPLAGIAEINLPAVQPGSSIMPGKVNPVICESVAMVCAQVIGNDTTITVGAQAGNFQLNTMLPVIAHNLLQSILILTNAITALDKRAIQGFSVNAEKIAETLGANPVLVTALNPIIGYAKAAEIAKKAWKESRPILDVALEMTELSKSELELLLNPQRLTEAGNPGAGDTSDD
ncbi:MAG: class II fumarate hydratase [Gammaproteobacteria bacterium]|nr:class II fumarate hydratase [Gammaproteobacteria bacterium]